MPDQRPNRSEHRPMREAPQSAVDGEERPKKATRKCLTQNACSRCRQKKSKCDGRRPVCARCEKYGAECKYDVAQEGITKMQNLQLQLENRHVEYRKLMQFFEALRRGSDHDATTLLARLRLGESVDSLLQPATQYGSPVPMYVNNPNFYHE